VAPGYPHRHTTTARPLRTETVRSPPYREDMTTTPVLGTRELNRATLDRQLLLRRAGTDPADAVAHLVGLQTQVPPNHYTALWSRLADFDAEDFSRRFEAREFVRLTLMRGTLHTVTAADALALRSLFQDNFARALRSNFSRALPGVDTGAVLARSRELLAEQPMTGAELGGRLAEEWPAGDRQALGMVARHLLPLVQLPPRGLWQRGGRPRLALVADWLGAEPTGQPDVDALVLRYLAAFGPASVKDVQMWSGLTRLREVVDRHRGTLRTFRTEDGAELFDLPDAPRPGADVPAPPRFLPEFDNVYLGHADRTRIVPDAATRALMTNAVGNLARPVFLADGFVAGRWHIDHDRALTTATLTLRPFAELPRATAEDVAAEGARLLAFHVPEAEHAVLWAD
jgi:hypothetical protein